MNSVAQNKELLRCVFLPKWPANPYQDSLADHLEQLGAKVKSIDPHLIFYRQIIGTSRPDILHLHSLNSFFRSSNTIKSLARIAISLGQLIMLKLAGVKIVWTVHDLKNHENRQLLLDRICSTMVSTIVDSMIAHCDTAKSEIGRIFKIKNIDKVSVIPHANFIGMYENTITRNEARKALGLSESDLVFLSLGLIRPYKGVPELIDAFKKLPHDHIQLVIAGSPTTAELGDIIKKKIEGQQNIRFIPGFVPDEQIQTYINACDAAVFAFRDIFTSGSIILAMSFARACIAPAKGCIGEILEDNAGGFSYDPESQEGLLRALRRAIQAKDQLKRMGEYNYQFIERWSWRRIASMTLDVYRRC